MSFNIEGIHGGNVVIPTGATAGAALTGLSGAATTYSTSAFAFTASGVWAVKAAVAGGASPTTDAATGLPITLTAGKARAVVWVVDAAGTVKALAGPIVTNDGAGTPCHLPGIPAGHTAFAAHVLQAGSTLSGTWTFGVSNWNATGLTVGAVRNLFSGLTGPLLTA